MRQVNRCEHQLLCYCGRYELVSVDHHYHNSMRVLRSNIRHLRHYRKITQLDEGIPILYLLHRGEELTGHYLKAVVRHQHVSFSSGI